jgi:uncharacterized protein YuzE
MMLLQYDDEVDALYVSFREIEAGGVKKVRMVDDRRNVDYDDAGQPIGVEFLCVSEGVSLDGLPRADEIARALRAFAPSIAALA